MSDTMPSDATSADVNPGAEATSPVDVTLTAARSQFKAVPVSKLRNDLFQVIEQVEGGGRAVTLTRRGRPVAVLLSHEEYEKLIESLEVLCDPDFFDEFGALSTEDGF